MTDAPLELFDPDRDVLTMQVDGDGVWVTCTSRAQEVTVGPLPRESIERWLAAARK